MEKKSIISLLLVLSIASRLLAAGNPQQASQWPEKKVWDWYNSQPWLVGCNYLPSTASNQLEMWQADTFDPETIDKEFGWASDIGFNIVRVFLHDMLWQQNADGFAKRIDKVLELADKHNIKVMLVLFDSCWNPYPALGKQPEPKPHVHNPNWVQSPHIEILKDPSKWDQLKDYAQGIVKRYRTDSRVIIWNVYNEPGNNNQSAYGKLEPENKEELSLELLKQAFGWVREAAPEQPITASVWRGGWNKDSDVSGLNKFALNNSDLIEFHVYHGPEIVKEWINTLKEYNRPIICGEYMSRPTGSTFENILPILKEHKVGAISWGFVSGRSQTIYPWDSWAKEYTEEPQVWFHDILRPDGTPYNREEIEFIKKIIK